MKQIKTTRKCTGYCKKELPLNIEYFYKSKNCPYGFDYKCKECTKKRRLNNIDYFKEKVRKYNQEHSHELIVYYNERYKNNKKYYKKYKKENLDIIKEKRKTYNINHKKEINEYQKTRRKENIQIQIKDNLSTRVFTKIKSANGVKNKKTMDLIGCSIENIKQYLESLLNLK